MLLGGDLENKKEKTNKLTVPIFPNNNALCALHVILKNAFYKWRVSIWFCSIKYQPVTHAIPCESCRGIQKKKTCKIAQKTGIGLQS